MTVSSARIPATMRRVVVTALRHVEVIHVPVPEPAAGEALVQMSWTGVCGSDTNALHGRHPLIPIPYAPGHEVTGTVRALRNAGGTAKVGQRVVVNPPLPCWDCKQCRAGRENLCERLQFFGCGHAQGGMADYFTVPACRLHPVPDDLDDRQAILIEPLATPVHAVRLGGPVSGKAVAVLGAGTIGLMVLATALHHGAGRVVVTDVRPEKLHLAERLGAHATVDAARDDATAATRAALGESADVVFDCVAVQQTLDQALALADKGGSVVVVGVPPAPVTVPLPFVQDHQLRIQGSATYLRQDYEEAVQLLRAGRVRPSDFITAEFSLDEVALAFAAASSGEHIKVIVTP